MSRDDIVGVRIQQHASNAVLIIQRRSEALKTISQCSGEGVGRVKLVDIVDNPVLLDLGVIASAVIVPVTIDAKLREGLEPIPPGFDLAARLPELLPRQEPEKAAASKVSAADQDPLERAQAGG